MNAMETPRPTREATGVTRFIHKNWAGKRDYECTNICACIAENSPGEQWRECLAKEWDALEAKGMGMLWKEAGVQYYGWL